MSGVEALGEGVEDGTDGTGDGLGRGISIVKSEAFV